MEDSDDTFLLYATEWIEVNREELENNSLFYKSTAVFNPISADDLDPKDPDLLNKMFEPYIFEHEGAFYRLDVSNKGTNRSELEKLEVQFEQKLRDTQARKGGICPIREKCHN